MKIGLGHIVVIIVPIVAFMSLVLYHSSKPQWKVFNAVGFPVFVLAFFVFVYFLLKYCAKEEATE